jgi:hypothetical protein
MLDPAESLGIQANAIFQTRLTRLISMEDTNLLSNLTASNPTTKDHRRP